MTALVVVSAGTYHLPFDRLGRWVGVWLAEHPEVHLIMQHGTSAPVPGAENVDMLAPARLLELYDAADAVVLQGGAGGVMDARSRHRIPIVVPRIPGLGEVVDHHQLEFARQLASWGVVHLVESEMSLHAALDDAIWGTLATRPDRIDPTPGSRNVSQILAQLPERKSRRATSSRILWTLRQGRR